MRKGNQVKKFLFLAFCMLMLSARLPAQNTATATLSAAASTCTTTNVCLALPINPNVGGVTFTVSANATSNTIQFEATANGGATWVALNATPSNSATAASSTTSTGTWQANVAGYTSVRVRMSSLVSGTTTVTLSTSTASARAGGGGGGGGAVTGCSTSGGVAYENGTANTLTCEANLTWSSANNSLVASNTTATQTTPLAIFNANSSDNCVTSLGASPVCIYAGTGDEWGLYISGNAAVEDNVGLVINDTQTTTGVFPSGYIFWDQSQGLVLVANHSSDIPQAQIALGENDGDPNGVSASIIMACNVPDPRVMYEGGSSGLVVNASVNCNTGEIEAGDVASGTHTGFFSIADGAGTHKLSMKAPGTMSADAEWDYPISAGTAGQVLTSQGGAGTPMTWTASTFPTNVLISNTAPSVAANGCGTTGASIASNNGTAAFKVNVGTTNSGACTITMPTATTDWVCSATDITTTSTTVSQTKSVPTSGHLTTEITLQNYTDVSGTHAWVDSDVIAVSCMGE